MMKRPGEKLYSLVFRQIRAYILQNNLQPGDLLPTEQALVDMLGVSRNVLREAIKSMELLGMVSAQPGRGTILQKFSLDFVFQNVIFAAAGEEDNAVAEMLDIRKRLELGYMRQAFASLRQEDVLRLRGIMEEIKKQWDVHQLFHAEDKDFHLAIFSRVNNQTLLSMMEAIWDVDANFKTEEKVKHLDDTIIKHENIVRALESGNEEAFEAAMMAHFASGKYRPETSSFAEY
ncbi:MAG: FadR family transcriptional regulator [Clostridiales bacterium]|nr:FadR family transcriptional regulator [Clostridiales bacterium]